MVFFYLYSSFPERLILSWPWKIFSNKKCSKSGRNCQPDQNSTASKLFQCRTKHFPKRRTQILFFLMALSRPTVTPVCEASYVYLLVVTVWQSAYDKKVQITIDWMFNKTYNGSFKINDAIQSWYLADVQCVCCIGKGQQIKNNILENLMLLKQ